MQARVTLRCQPPELADRPGAARAAGLQYVNDNMPGIRRKPAREGFAYTCANGRVLRERATLARIDALAIPPAWIDVWICALENGHLQASGRDARGRKQYRYHPRWRHVRDEVKYERMIGFGQSLPTIRCAVAAALKRPGLPREKVLATIVQLLQMTLIRVGNAEYARENHSFGLTTLCGRHVQVDGGAVQFRFRGKSGVFHAITVNDRRLARIITRMRELPGQELFHYQDGDGQMHALGSADVNDYLRSVSGHDYTAKDFRTWSGTVQAAIALRDCGPAASATQAKKNIVRAIQSVADKLGNTAAICRKCYVHPAVLEAYLDGALGSPAAQVPDTGNASAPGCGLHQDEIWVLDVLKRQAKTGHNTPDVTHGNILS